MATIGPVAIDIYPLKAWTRWPEGINARDVWKLCGPTVEHHHDRLPLWQVFCAVYLEGLQHGAEIVRSQQEGKQP